MRKLERNEPDVKTGKLEQACLRYVSFGKLIDAPFCGLNAAF